jgi:hypothetical protein
MICRFTFPPQNVLVYDDVIGKDRNGENTMTQSQIVQTLAEKCEITKKVAGSMMDTLAQPSGSTKAAG